MLLFENLDLTPIRSILWTGLHREGPGRPVEYNPECDLRALMLRQLEQTPYVKDLVKRLRRDRSMRTACGYGSHVPTEAHFSQMKQRIGIHGFRAIEAWLRRQALSMRESQPLSAVGLVQAACMDSTDFQAWSSRDPHDACRGLGDPDAKIGRTRKGFILGYQSLFLVDIEGFPLGHEEASANVNEIKAASLRSAARRRRSQTVRKAPFLKERMPKELSLFNVGRRGSCSDSSQRGLESPLCIP